MQDFYFMVKYVYIGMYVDIVFGDVGKWVLVVVFDMIQNLMKFWRIVDKVWRLEKKKVKKERFISYYINVVIF